jgi:hypothetical protein
MSAIPAIQADLHQVPVLPKYALRPVVWQMKQFLPHGNETY